VEKEINFTNNAEELLQVFKKGEEFAKDLLKENERLSLRLAQIERAGETEGDNIGDNHYQGRIKAIEHELNLYKNKFTLLEDENRKFAVRFKYFEEESNNLTNLYVASYQLHSSLDFSEVLRIIVEIIINLIGAKKFAVFLIDEKTNELTPVVSEGIQGVSIPRIKIGDGIIGKTARFGKSYFSDNLKNAKEFNPIEPAVCIPLKIKEDLLGVICIYNLLTHKQGFTDVDYELFNLLAGHAATAIFSAKLYTQSERKLTTIQGFLDLLKHKANG